MKLSIPRAFYTTSALLMLAGPASAVDLRVSTDFEGGSARVESVDPAARVIRFMPGGDPGRGWPCWWYLRADGVAKGERLTLDLAASALPARRRPHPLRSPRRRRPAVGRVGAALHATGHGRAARAGGEGHACRDH